MKGARHCIYVWHQTTSPDGVTVSRSPSSKNPRIPQPTHHTYARLGELVVSDNSSTMQTSSVARMKRPRRGFAPHARASQPWQRHGPDTRSSKQDGGVLSSPVQVRPIQPDHRHEPGPTENRTEKNISRNRTSS